MIQPKGLLFDLDGVLLDTEPLHGQAWTKTAASFGTELNNDQLKLLQGRRRHDCALLVKNWIKKTIEIEDVLKVHQPISKEFLTKATAMPGAESLVTWCNENNFPIGLVTSSSSVSVKVKTSPHPWLSLFLIRVQGDDPSLSAGKPNPDPYLLGAKKLNLRTNECWAIEDSLSGTKSAYKAGCKVFVLRNNSNENLIEKNFQSSNSTPEYLGNLNILLRTIKGMKSN